MVGCEGSRRAGYAPRDRRPTRLAAGPAEGVRGELDSEPTRAANTCDLCGSDSTDRRLTGKTMSAEPAGWVRTTRQAADKVGCMSVEVKDARGHSISHPAAHDSGLRGRGVAVLYVRRDRRSDTRTLTRYLTNISCLRLDFVDRLVGKRYMGGSVRRRNAIAVLARTVALGAERGAQLRDPRPAERGREGAAPLFSSTTTRGDM